MGYRRIGAFFPDRPAISADVRSKLVETLFADQGPLVVGTVGSVVAGLFFYFRGEALWALALVLGSLLVLAGRLRLAHAYRGRRRSDDPMLWADRFTVGAIANSLLWALASGAVVFQPDAFLQMVIITGQAGYVTGSAVRNAAVPRAALLQVVLPLGLLSLACLATGEACHMAYSFFVVVGLVGAVQIIGFLNRNTCALLVAEERAAKASEDLGNANRLLERLATTDVLTGAINRRGFDAALASACRRAIREQADVSLLLLDIDHFKALNDSLGHQAGDECLRLIGGCLKNAVQRPVDLVARYGGEEFAILLPDTDYAGAGSVAEQVRAAIQTLERFAVKLRGSRRDGSSWRIRGA